MRLQGPLEVGHLCERMTSRLLVGQGDDEHHLWVSRGKRSHQKTAVSTEYMARNSFRRLACLRAKSIATGAAPAKRIVKEVKANSFPLHLRVGKQAHNHLEFQK